MAAPYGLYRGADPGLGSPSLSGPSHTSSRSSILSTSEEEIEMISVDKVYLLTFSSPKSVFSLQVYDADEPVASPFTAESSLMAPPSPIIVERKD